MQNKVAFSKDWKWVAIQDLSVPTPNAVVDGPFGSNLKTSDYVEKGVPVLQGGNITGNKFSLKELRFVKKQKAWELKRSFVRVGDLLVVKIGSIGYAAIIDNLGNFESALIPANLLKATFDKNKINNQYILYYLTSDYGFQDLNDLAGRTAQPAISLKKFKELLIPVPPLSEQSRIAEIFDTIDEAIQKTEALISKLKAMKQGLLHDLLTRGLDENGKLRDPKAHPEQFKDSPLRRIPKGWDVCELNDVALKIQDGTHFSPKTTQGPFRYLTSKNIRFGEVDLSECGWIGKKEHESIYSRCDVKYGDVLLTKDGANTGNAAINRLNEPVSLLSSIAFIRCDNERLHSDYVLHYLLSPNSQQRIKDLMSGNAITRLTLTIIKSFKISVPDYKEQCRIIEPLNLYDTRIRAEEKYRDKLKLQKKGLMHDLLTGKVRVRV